MKKILTKSMVLTVMVLALNVSVVAASGGDTAYSPYSPYHRPVDTALAGGMDVLVAVAVVAYLLGSYMIGNASKIKSLIK